VRVSYACIDFFCFANPVIPTSSAPLHRRRKNNGSSRKICTPPPPPCSFYVLTSIKCKRTHVISLLRVACTFAFHWELRIPSFCRWQIASNILIAYLLLFNSRNILSTPKTYLQNFEKTAFVNGKRKIFRSNWTIEMLRKGWRVLLYTGINNNTFGYHRFPPIPFSTKLKKTSFLFPPIINYRIFKFGNPLK
jgi:hypothetical protein